MYLQLKQIISIRVYDKGPCGNKIKQQKKSTHEKSQRGAAENITKNRKNYRDSFIGIHNLMSIFTIKTFCQA